MKKVLNASVISESIKDKSIPAELLPTPILPEEVCFPSQTASEIELEDNSSELLNALLAISFYPDAGKKDTEIHRQDNLQF
jgi:hypothetical protein